jgi:hypothetical protein
VTADGKVLASLSGRSVGTATSLGVTTVDRTVEYVRIPPLAWAREPGATWLQVAVAQAPDSPITVLGAPATLVFATSAGSGSASAGPVATTLNATYAATALGLTGDPVKVTISIDGSTVTFRYERAESGRAVVSLTTLRPATMTKAIAAPLP